MIRSWKNNTRCMFKICPTIIIIRNYFSVYWNGFILSSNLHNRSNTSIKAATFSTVRYVNPSFLLLMPCFSVALVTKFYSWWVGFLLCIQVLNPWSIKTKWETMCKTRCYSIMPIVFAKRSMVYMLNTCSVYNEIFKIWDNIDAHCAFGHSHHLVCRRFGV